MAFHHTDASWTAYFGTGVVSMSAWILFLLAAAAVVSACDTGINRTSLQGPYDLPGESPVISSVQWQFTSDCDPSAGGTLAVFVVVTDPDTPADSLTYLGAVNRCGGITAARNTLNCARPLLPDLTYFGSVWVRDPEGNSDSMDFTISPCVDGQEGT
jgi:hypothetical protein